MKHQLIILLFILSSCGSIIKGGANNAKKETTTVAQTQFNLIDTVFKNLNIEKEDSKINVIATKENPNNPDETFIIISENEINPLEEDTQRDSELTSHIVIANSRNGKIKNYYSESSKENGWVSDAIYIENISIDTKAYRLSKSQVALGIKALFRSSSQPNPYRYTALSLYIKDGKSLKKVIDNLIVNEYSGEVNINACEGVIKLENNELTVLESCTNGYYNIQLKNTIFNSIFEIDSVGNCEPVVKSKAEKIAVLKYNNTKYE